MAESFEMPDKTERLQINLEDDVRAFLLSRLTGNQLDPEKRAELSEMGVDVRRLSKPSYLAVNSGCAISEDSQDGCHVGAEGVMAHEDEGIVHLAFKCGDDEHEMHYSTIMPLTIIEMAKAMESVWPGSIMGPLFDQAAKLGRAEVHPLEELSEEGAERILKAIMEMDEDEDLDLVGLDEEFDEEDEEDEEDEDLLL